MGQPYGRKRQSNKHLAGKKGFRTKRRKKDPDIIRAAMLDEHVLAQLASRPVDHDLPGSGQFFCVACDKHHVDMAALKTHMRSKPHKRRITKLKAAPIPAPPPHTLPSHADNS